MIKRLKKAKENKKGFTLVELIVVIVILAILAALLVPALLGWINKAKEKQLTVQGRTVLLAAQSAGSEAYASGTVIKTEEIGKYLDGDCKGITYSVEYVKYKVINVIVSDGKNKATWTETNGWNNESGELSIGSTDKKITDSDGTGTIKDAITESKEATTAS